MSAVDAVLAAFRVVPDGSGPLGWVMGRVWYDRLRSEVVSDEQENERALAHAYVPVQVGDSAPAVCPVCGSGVSGWRGLATHVAEMADPDFREPGAGDRLMGLPLAVEPGDGAPRLVRV